MRMRGVVAALLLFALAAVGAGAVAQLRTPATTEVGAPAPIAGTDPDVPTTPPRPTIEPNDDITYPPLDPPTDFARHRIGNYLQQWRYVAPRGWAAYCVGQSGVETLLEDDADADTCTEVRYRPADEPVVGGYSLRVKAVDDHLSTSTMVSQKLASLEASPDLEEVTVLQQTDDRLYVTLLTPLSSGGYLLRYNFFQWLAAPGSSEATLEMSVAGREADDDGLRALFDAFAERTRAVEE